MTGLMSKRFDEPDDVINVSNCTGQIVTLGEVFVGRYVYEPGWIWSLHVKPVVGTPDCRHHHQGVVLSGRMQIDMSDGARRIFGPGDVFNIPPGHDAFVVGDEACVMIMFTGVRGWAKPNTGEERVLATLLVTDIVGSTALAGRLGDVRWKEVLAQHSDRVRRELDQYRGLEIATTGDGFLAMFDGTARAVRCGAAICSAARLDGMEVRAGVHVGEVERHADNLRGMAVHVASRIASLAGAGEVFVSATAATLLEGAGLALTDAGEHELKGVEGRRRVFRLAENPT